MRRREILVLLCAVLGSTAPALGQSQLKVGRIGFLGLTNLTALRTRVDAFRAGLREHSALRSRQRSSRKPTR